MIMEPVLIYESRLMSRSNTRRAAGLAAGHVLTRDSRLGYGGVNGPYVHVFAETPLRLLLPTCSKNRLILAGTGR